MMKISFTDKKTLQYKYCNILSIGFVISFISYYNKFTLSKFHIEAMIHTYSSFVWK